MNNHRSKCIQGSITEWKGGGTYFVLNVFFDVRKMLKFFTQSFQLPENRLHLLFLNLQYHNLIMHQF